MSKEQIYPLVAHVSYNNGDGTFEREVYEHDILSEGAMRALSTMIANGHILCYKIVKGK
jgi:hypothetical protein